MTNKTRKETVRHATNPFIGDLVVTKRAKIVRLSPLGKDDNVLVNQSTGEVQGTHVVTYKQVDSNKFVKLFPAMVGAQFDLNKPGIKAFTVLMWAIQHEAIGKDLVVLDKYALEAFREAHPDLHVALPTIRKGLVELEAAKFIAKAQRLGSYYINPSLVFNGDRVAFTTVLERSDESSNQQNLPLENA